MDASQEEGAGFTQAMIPLERLASVLADPAAALPAARDGRVHLWMSQASFSRPNRLKRNVSGVGVCWVDLDLRHDNSDVELRGLTPSAALRELLEACQSKGVPAPSAVFWTGRGMVAKWYLTQPLSHSALPRWDAVQLWLAKTLAPFGSDLLAKDACRILRLPGSLNPRAEGPYNRCEPLFARESFGEVERVCFDDLADKVLPLSRKEVTARKQAKATREALTAASLPKKSRAGLAQGQLQDFRRLAAMVPPKERGEGWSNAVVLLASASLAVAVNGDLGRWERELMPLARELVPHWSAARIVASSAAVRARLAARARGATVSLFRFTHEKILDMLGARAYVSQLSTILSAEEARVRKRRRDRERYAAKRKPREAGREGLAAQVLALRQTGMPMAEVAAQLGVNRTHAYALYKRALAGEGVSAISPLYDGEALGDEAGVGPAGALGAEGVPPGAARGREATRGVLRASKRFASARSRVAEGTRGAVLGPSPGLRKAVRPVPGARRVAILAGPEAQDGGGPPAVKLPAW